MIEQLAWTAVLACRLLAPAAATPANPAAKPSGVFTDRATEAGLTFVHHNGMSGKRWAPEIMGPGVALLDYDNDGKMDIFLVQGGPLGPGAKPVAGDGSRLYHNESWT